MKGIVSLCLVLLSLVGLPHPGVAAVTDDAVTEAGKLWDAIDISFRNVTFGQVLKPVVSELNPDNRLDLSRYTLESDFRPDFRAQFSRLDLTFKPRWDFRWDRWEDGPRDGQTHTDEEAYVNEWLVRIQPVDQLFLSYGREDLQWGPSILLSPSNPFFTDNGRNRPKKEVAGADYGRLVWTPDQRWTGSLIVNTDEGRKRLLDGFYKTYALKVDYLADQGYVSLILSKQESGEERIGGFVSWNLDEATVVYAEGSGTDEDVEALVGGSYTLTGGSTMTLEYFYNGFGSSSGDLLEMIVADDWKDSRHSLFRKNYLMLQYYDQDVMGKWSTLLRWTVGLDDNSSTLLGLYEYNVSDHVQLFVNGTLLNGDDDDEFGALLEYHAMAGVEFSF